MNSVKKEKKWPIVKCFCVEHTRIKVGNIAIACRNQSVRNRSTPSQDNKICRRGTWHETANAKTFHQWYRTVQLLCCLAYGMYIQHRWVDWGSSSHVKRTSRARSQVQVILPPRHAVCRRKHEHNKCVVPRRTARVRVPLSGSRCC